MYTAPLKRGDKLAYIPHRNPSSLKVYLVKRVSKSYALLHSCATTKEGFPEYQKLVPDTLVYVYVTEQGTLYTLKDYSEYSNHYAEDFYSVDEFLSSPSLLEKIRPCPKWLQDIRAKL